MTNVITQSQNLTASVMHNAYQQTSLLRSIMDSICNFFTGHSTECTMEKLTVQKMINNAIIIALQQQSKNLTAPGNEHHNNESIEIVVGGKKIFIKDDLRFGVSIQIEGEHDDVTISTNLKVQDFINNAIMTNGGGEINTRSVQKRISDVDIDEIEKESLKGYQQNGFLILNEDEQNTYDIPLFGTANENIHIARAQTIDADEMPATLRAMKEQVASIKGNTEKDHVMLSVLGVRKLQTKLMDSDHFITAVVSSNPNTLPIIVDSKDFAIYPEGITVLRSGHQAAIDTVSCGAHALRAMNSLAIQLVSDITFSELTPPPVFSSEISGDSIDVNQMVSDINAERNRQLREACPVPDGAILSFNDVDEIDA